MGPPRAVRARKRLGQHFLHDPYVIDRILETVAPARGDRIVEIGGGLGALSFPLAHRVTDLTVIELDERCAEALETSPSNPGNITVRRADALRFDFAALAGDARLRVVGNLPYNISTPLLFHVLGYRGIIADLHVMLQKEIVDRMTARPGGKQYGRLTVMLSAWADIEACFDIGSGAFFPPPKVRSTFVRIEPRATPRFEIRDEARYAAVVSHLFSMRRKTIGRALKARASAADIEAAGLDPRARPETLTPADFETLAGLWA